MRMDKSVYSKDMEQAIRVLIDSCEGKILEDVCYKNEVYLPFQSELINAKECERKSILAKVVVYAFGYGLMEVKEIRDSLLGDASSRELLRWQSGGLAEVRACRKLGLPATFAGIDKQEQKSAVEIVFPPSESFQLQDYQKELADKAVTFLERGVSCLVSIPTGAGKTVVATAVLEGMVLGGAKVIVWIAHTEELCEQAIFSLKKSWRGFNTKKNLRLIRGWGKYGRKARSSISSELESHDGEVIFLCSTPQSIASYIFDEDEELSPSIFAKAISDARIVVIDEAHRAGADSYKAIHEKILSISSSGNVSFLGLSATPVRASFSDDVIKETYYLKRIFPELVEPKNTLSNGDYFSLLVNRGVLAEPVFFESSCDSAVSQADYIFNILQSKQSSSIVFCHSILHANAISIRLGMMGLPSVVVHSGLSESDRRQKIALLSEGKVKVVCNCEILTTGFDLPVISDVFLARETKSPVLYKQMIGRGLRGALYGGSKTCSIHILGFTLSFPKNPNTAEFSSAVWGS